METSAEINEIALALCKAQGEFFAAAKDSTNPHFKSKYADLTSCIDATRDALVKYDICVTQHPTIVSEGIERFIIVTTLVSHKSGQYFKSTLKMFATEVHPQKIGSIITYARRYAYAAILQISQEDDDTNSQRELPQEPVKKPIPPMVEKAIEKFVPPTGPKLFDKNNETHLASLNKAIIERDLLQFKDAIIEKMHQQPISELNNIISQLKGKK